MKVTSAVEIPLQFRTRIPPRRELYCKLFVLFLFGIFCALVGLHVAPLPLPQAKRMSGAHPAIPVDDVEVFTFSTLSPEERAKLAELSAHLSVPYLSPWGADERPALFFMWHLLYRSIKPDLEHFTADLHNVTVTTPPTSTAAVEAHGANATPTTLEKLQVVIQVVETENGYITTSLARYLPEALVFSVMVNSSAEARQPYQRYRDTRNAERPTRMAAAARILSTVSPEKRVYAEEVAAKVERVLVSPAAENVTEASQLPGMNRPPVTFDPIASLTPVTNAAAGEGGVDRAVAPPPTSLPSSPRLFLCVPANVFSASYYTAPTMQKLTVNYQVLLSPYVVLQAAKTAAEFDATLRAVLTRANIASFIALPWLWDDGVDQNDEAQRRRAQIYAKELTDFDRWYGENEGYPLHILRRALQVPEVETQYHISIVPLGTKRWAGALRELFRVVLTNLSATVTETTTTTVDPLEDAVETAPKTTEPSKIPPVSFGCTTRTNFLQCAARLQHASCERFF